MKNQVVVGLGSNISPENNIAKAKKILMQKYTVIAESTFVQTKPIGFTNQPEFTNGAVLLETKLSQDLLKSNLKSIEQNLGRTHGENKFGPRTVDLDIVIWNNTVVDKDFYQRDYLKKAVLELLPNSKYIK